MATLTVYPDAEGASDKTSIDGRVQHRDVSTLRTWAEIRGGDGTTGSGASVADMVNISAASWDDDFWSVITKGIILLDVSAISGTASAATLSLYGHSKTDALVILPNINIYSSDPLLNTSLRAADFTTLGTTPYCDTPITYANWDITGFNDFILNAAGLAALNAAIAGSGIFKIGVRNANYDAANVEPSNAPAAQSSNLYWHTADNEQGIDRTPKFVITYTGASLSIVTTQAVTNLVTTTGTGHGNITFLGNPAATQHGHCWNITGLPTISQPLIHTASGGRTENGVPSAIGAFTSSITGLVAGNIYYIRAYATNTEGTSYGEQVTFIAGAPGGSDLAGVLAVVEDRLHYSDAYGVERWLKGTIV